jgi:hypothetical protein
VTGEADLTVLSAVQELTFSRCVVEFELLVDGAGRVKVHHLSMLGQRPCNDLDACFVRGFMAPAWDGAIESGRGGPVLRLDACLDTCLGRFRGPLEMPLRRERGRLWLDGSRARVGSSGWTLDGRFLLRPERPIEIRARS